MNSKHIFRTTRRGFITTSCAAISTYAPRFALADLTREKTRFQIACMTLPYSQFPLIRAIKGIKEAGFQYIAWGTTHRESDAEKSVPVMPIDGTESMAKELGKRCRDHGLEPVMMFSMIYPEHTGAIEKLTQRFKQASAAGIPQVLTFGHTEGGNRSRWIEVFKTLGPVARDLNVTLVVKQHGGETGTGKACAEIIREVNDPGIKVNYDAGNVMDYLNVDPLPDIVECASEIRSMCMKDHRNWPKDEDCAPGLGEIDHYRLLNTIAFTGMTVPLCCENIASPLLPRATTPEKIDAQAMRTRIFLETVIAGLHAAR
ncbi:MAG: sugar phosphate isomerase/epimerase family protein [Pirellula sp.]|jgi:sugar phosphate isomerase/epimerase|nr:sugar phosphate isomerase/epimerase [Pirellula sp.]